jgi:hypothetical protein
MQKYVKEGGAVGIDNLLRWNSNSDAVAFLSATTSATSAAELLKVCYFPPIPSPNISRTPKVTVAASPLDSLVGERVTHRYNISGAGGRYVSVETTSTLRKRSCA